MRELMERYRPSVLWNDIAWPAPGRQLWPLFEDYYALVPDGVVNDRWLPWNPALAAAGWEPARRLIDAGARRTAERDGGLVPPIPPHFDVRTPEYVSFADVQRTPWECVRGIDRSFGYNANSRAEHFLTQRDLLWQLVDIVAKGGNLLLNVGPRGIDAQIPDEQLTRLDWLGDWMGRCRDAVAATRPWVTPGTTSGGSAVRYTTRDGTVFAFIQDAAGTVTLPGLRGDAAHDGRRHRRLPEGVARVAARHQRRAAADSGRRGAGGARAEPRRRRPRRSPRLACRSNEGHRMHHASLGPLGNVSRLTLGGGGLGQIWGASSDEEAVATIRAALDAGIDIIDTAPMYGACEAVIGAAFHGVLPTGVRLTTKCQLGEPPAGTVAAKLEASLDASLGAMELEHADVYFLHSNICEDDTVYAHGNDQRAAFATPWSQYVEEVVPAFEDLKQRGRIGAWGITGIGLPATVMKALQHDTKPSVVQAIANLLDSPGGIRRYADPPRPRAIIVAARANGVGVMGIRAVQAGALTASFDRVVKERHPDALDYQRAAPFRELCAEIGVGPALLAHRYALDIDGIDTVVLGVKNRRELAQCLEAEALGALPADLRARIDGLGLRSA